MMIARPRVTIGVPAYSAERYLALSLDSLRAQTYEDIEIVVCDNASTDRTAEIAADYAARDPRVRRVRNATNIGAGRNFIRALEVARGELFRWQSADDLSAPTFVERCLEVLDTQPDVIQAFPRTTIIDEHGNELRRYDERIQTSADSPRERYLHVMRNLGLVNAFFGVMRADWLRRTAVHGAYVGADLVVQAEIALYGKLVEVPEYLFFRRMHSGAHSAMNLSQAKEFYNPQRAPRAEFIRWRQLSERLRSVRRSPLPLVENTLLGAAIVREATAARDELLAELRSVLRAQMA